MTKPTKRDSGCHTGSALSRTSSVDSQAREETSSILRARDVESVDSRARGVTPSTNRTDSRMEKKQDNIRQDWGFRNADTAIMMYKRAKKMKYKVDTKNKKRQLDPLQKLARFREKDEAEAPSRGEYLKEKRNDSNKREYFEAKTQAFAAQDVTPREEREQREAFTYKWLDAHASFYDAEEQVEEQKNKRTAKQQNKTRTSQHSVKSSTPDFLPRLTPDALNGG